MKQTEIGLIPDDWEVKRLGDNVDIFRGGSPRPIEKYLTTNADGINWIKIGDVRPNDKYIHQTEEKIISEGKARSREVKKGDFILSNSMSFGRPYILNIDGCIHDGWLTIQNYAVSFDKEYLYYLLGSDEIFKQYVQMAAGSSVQNLNKEKVSDLQLKVPPLPEQQRIAKALSDVDALISTTEKLIQKKKNIKQGAMQNLLTGKKRLPGFAKSNNTKMTELGEIPEDWEVKSLRDIAFVTKLAGFEFTAHVNYSEIGKIIALRGLNVKKGYLVLDDVKFIDNSNFSKLDRSKLYINDLLFTYVGTVGNVALVNKNDTYYLAPNVALIRGNKYVYSYFLMYLMLSQHFFDNQIQALMSTTSQAALSMTNIRLFKIPLPSIEEQTAIANVLSSMDKEIETLNTKLEKYRNLKTAMMQQLLTGKIRL